MITSIYCVNCMPEGNIKYFEEIGYTPKGDWYISKNVAECTNCGYKRPYRKIKQNTEVTKAQKDKSQRIQGWFIHEMNDGKVLYKVEETFQDETGFLYLSVYTDSNVYVQDGGFFKIGRRGGTNCLATYGLSKVYDEKYYNEQLKGYIVFQTREDRLKDIEWSKQRREQRALNN